MTISNGIKFLTKSYADIDYDASTVGMTSGSSSRDNMRDRRAWTYTQSLGSNDATTETWTVTFDGSYSISRLILAKNNFKNFNVKYYNGSSYVDFANVVTKEGTQATVTETANAKTTNYYEFDAVATTAIQLTLNTTQTADAEKTLYELYVGAEVGTLAGYPAFRPTFHREQLDKKSIRGRDKFTLLDEQFLCALAFAKYPTAADHAIIQSLWDGWQEFVVYPCGGNVDQFRFPEKGNRLEDFYLVWFQGDFAPNYDQGCYALGLTYNVQLVEVT